MTNFQVYKKTLSFSLVGFLVDLMILVFIGGCATGGFFIFNKMDTNNDGFAIVGLIVGLVVGSILSIVFTIFISNRIKAAQISMMVKGVTEGELPEHTYSEGFKEIKGRFGRITGFFVITHLIKSVFNQLGRSINRIGTAVGGQVGNSVTSVIDSAIQTVVAYLCDCCLGWILYRKDENAFKAGCEGAVIFFKHGKALAKNLGRIFGMGLLAFILVGGAFFGLSYVIFMQFPGGFNTLVAEIIEANAKSGGDPLPEFITNPATFMIVAAALVGVIMFGIIHSVLIRPFILTGVLRNYMDAGLKDMPTEKDFAELEAKAPKFAKLRAKAEN